jgi:hypothetical protein
MGAKLACFMEPPRQALPVHGLPARLVPQGGCLESFQCSQCSVVRVAFGLFAWRTAFLLIPNDSALPSTVIHLLLTAFFFSAGTHVFDHQESYLTACTAFLLAFDGFLLLSGLRRMNLCSALVGHSLLHWP